MIPHMSSPVDSYKVTAPYYDAVYAMKEDLKDVAFYADLARRSGGPVLELACGTGRVLLPIARQGIAIHGLDNSGPMLEILKDKLKRESKDVRELVSVFPGDMRTFRSNRKYALVTIPFRPLQHMHTVEDQLAALKTSAFHLDEDGLLAFNVFYPKFEMIGSGEGEEILEFEWPDKSHPGRIMRRYFRKESVDKISQNFSLTFVYRTYQDGKVVAEEMEPLTLSYYTYPHLRALFLLAGLEIVEEYGSFDRAPMDNQAVEMIFVLRKGR